MRNGFDDRTSHSLPEWNRSVYSMHTDLSAFCRHVCYGRRVRVWIDISNSPQVPFFRPLIALLRERGHEVSRHDARVRADDSSFSRCTASSTTSSGRATEAPARPGRRARWPAASARSGATRRGARLRPRALARLARAADGRALARHPVAYAFDYEFARVQHGFGCRAARRVVVPDAIPQDRLDRLGARACEGAPLPGPEGGVLPPRVHARPERPRRARPRPRARPRRRADAARRLALPPPGEPALRGRARATRARRAVPRRRPPAHGGAASRDRRAGAALRPRARATPSTHRASSRSPTSSSPPAAR